ncbi:N-acetylglucosamine-6-phosphate deacetylase [Clostridium ganghwense]|uniref:N-acetylglucosamine-6-phosphate deacetylase n=1 Tax=Clostridium ganghwense TaxID=312089 RepID=A0ABT4CLJ0_9CLOT|nr:N-acetylglucosamine-6-phosphate deacetylase [Clostridium ganghwense]MCY6369116.1 N-acetylglucosamine-6-phosphate deacetylase [Clostridium ganghwense]
MKAITNGKIITEEGILQNSSILFDNKIKYIISKDKLGEYDLEEIIDVNGKYISPGFIDLHIHGSGGSDTMDGSIEDIIKISSTICQNGVTAFLPTTMTMSREAIYNALECVKECMGMELNGAKVLGAHLEGPFINEKYKGAQNPEFIQKPSYDFVQNYLDVIKIITLATEMDENDEFMKKMKVHPDVVLSIGHTNATYEEAIYGIEKGITHATHIFNAMTPLHHRKPGVVGAVLGNDVNCELIADTIHVHPGLFQFLVNVKGKDRLVLITDSMRAGCMKCGEYDLGGQKVIVDETSARLKDGTLAGSILTLNVALKNMYKHTNLKIDELVKMASLNGAREFKIDKFKGSLKEGKDADITIFDSEFNVYLTIVEGKTVYNNLD